MEYEHQYHCTRYIGSNRIRCMQPATHRWRWGNNSRYKQWYYRCTTHIVPLMNAYTPGSSLQVEKV